MGIECENGWNGIRTVPTNRENKRKSFASEEYEVYWINGAASGRMGSTQQQQQQSETSLSSRQCVVQEGQTDHCKSAWRQYNEEPVESNNPMSISWLAITWSRQVTFHRRSKRNLPGKSPPPLWLVGDYCPSLRLHGIVTMSGRLDRKTPSKIPLIRSFRDLLDKCNGPACNVLERTTQTIPHNTFNLFFLSMWHFMLAIDWLG